MQDGVEGFMPLPWYAGARHQAFGVYGLWSTEGLDTGLWIDPTHMACKILSHIAWAPKKSCSFLNYLPNISSSLEMDLWLVDGGEWLTVAQHCHLWTSVPIPSRATKVAVGPIKENSVMYHRLP